MSENTDTLYVQPREVVDFAFDEEVSVVFLDMIRRSVPGYGSITDLLGLFAAVYAQPHSHIYDLGCSLGAATLALRRSLDLPGCRIIAVDNAFAMVERCRENIARDPSSNPVDVVCADIRDVVIENASLVILNFTLQFFDPAERLDLLCRIYAGLRAGGVLVLSEKVIFGSEAEQQFQEQQHLAFKRANGYTELEISQKRAALERVLIPEQLSAHHHRLAEAGFNSSYTWFQCFNFASIAAFKSGASPQSPGSPVKPQS